MEFEDTKGWSESVNWGTDNTLWPKEKVQKDKQLSTKHTCETKDWDEPH